jgi:hypothetical protein
MGTPPMDDEIVNFEYPMELVETLTDATVMAADTDEVNALSDAILDLCHKRPLCAVISALGMALAATQTMPMPTFHRALVPFVVITIAERCIVDGDDE